MSDNPDLNFTHLSDSNNDIEFTDFKPSSLLNFDEVWQPVTNLEFDKSTAVNKDVDIAISAKIDINASGSISIAEAPTGLAILGIITPTASGLMTSEEAASNIAINATYELKAVATGAAIYDSNVDRLAYHEVSSDFQKSKMTSIDKQSKFESSKALTNELSTDWQQ